MRQRMTAGAVTIRSRVEVFIGRTFFLFDTGFLVAKNTIHLVAIVCFHIEMVFIELLVCKNSRTDK